MTNNNNEFDPHGYDRDPMTSGPRIEADWRSHIDRINGPWPTGPAERPGTVPVRVRDGHVIPVLDPGASPTMPHSQLQVVRMGDLVGILVSAEQDAVAAFTALAHGSGGASKIRAVMINTLKVMQDVAPLAAGNPALEGEIQTFLKAAEVFLGVLQTTPVVAAKKAPAPKPVAVSPPPKEAPASPPPPEAPNAASMREAAKREADPVYTGVSATTNAEDVVDGDVVKAPPPNTPKELAGVFATTSAAHVPKADAADPDAEHQQLPILKHEDYKALDK